MGSYWNKPRKLFLVWAILIFLGFVATHFYQDPNINGVWVVLSLIGFYFMYKYMPLASPKMRNILILWIVVVGFGMLVSAAVFRVPSLSYLIDYLGVFWLILMGIGSLLNAIWYTPRLFILSGIMQIAAGLFILFTPSLLIYQYLIAAVVGAAGMLVLLPNR